MKAKNNFKAFFKLNSIVSQHNLIRAYI